MGLFQILAFLRRDYILASASPLASAWQIVGVLLVAPLLHYVGRLIPASRDLEPFGGDYFAFVVLGLAVFGLLSAGTAAAGIAIRQEQILGTLEAVLTMPLPFAWLVLGAALWPLIVAGTQLLLYLLIATSVFGADLTRANVFSALAVLILALISALSISVLGAALVLVFRHADPITAAFTGASALLGGVFYPTTVLPPLLQRVAEFLPWTHALRAVRLALLQGYGLGALRTEVIALVGFAILLAPASFGVFRRALRYAKASGTLQGY